MGINYLSIYMLLYCVFVLYKRLTTFTDIIANLLIRKCLVINDIITNFA